MDTSNKALSLQRINIPHKKNYKFPPEKRIEAVTKYLLVGNLRLTAELCGISYQLAKQWKQMDWWKDLEAEIRATRHVKVDNKLSKIVDKSLAAVEDRIDNGEIKVNRKTGEVFREPVSALTANKVANDLLMRQNEFSKRTIEETSSQKQATIADQIAELAKQFEQFNKARTVTVVAKEVTDAVPKEREKGLQEGVREVPGEAGPDQESSGEELCEDGDGESWESDEGGWEGCGSQDSDLEGGNLPEEESSSNPEGTEPLFQPHTKW